MIRCCSFSGTPWPSGKPLKSISRLSSLPTFPPPKASPAFFFKTKSTSAKSGGGGSLLSLLPPTINHPPGFLLTPASRVIERTTGLYSGFCHLCHRTGGDFVHRNIALITTLPVHSTTRVSTYTSPVPLAKGTRPGECLSVLFPSNWICMRK
jgi:hypothetical protein